MAEQLEAQLEKIEAENKKLQAENKKLKGQIIGLKDQIGTVQAVNVDLKEQQQIAAATISSLQARTARAEARAASLGKLLAHDGPHDPVSKYD